jgi:putative addiction module component (TIGR02574 family)
LHDAEFGSLGIDKLTPEEKMSLAEAIWDSIDAESRNVPRLTKEQRQELRRQSWKRTPIPTVASRGIR